MARFREAEENTFVGEVVETITQGCPICKSDAKGNDTILFFCKKCNMLFKREELLLSKEHVIDVMKEKLAEKMKENPLPKETREEKPLSEKQQTIITQLKKNYFASTKGNIVHASNCPYGKNIKKENRILFKDLAQATNYKKCKCITE